MDEEDAETMACVLASFGVEELNARIKELKDEIAELRKH